MSLQRKVIGESFFCVPDLDEPLYIVVTLNAGWTSIFFPIFFLGDENEVGRSRSPTPLLMGFCDELHAKLAMLLGQINVCLLLYDFVVGIIDPRHPRTIDRDLQ